MKRTNPLSMLLPSNHGYFLRDFAYDIGCTTSILLTELLELDDYYENSYASHAKYGDGWFYATEDRILRRTGIRRKQQESDIRTLKELEFIEVKVFGLPASRYFRINRQKIMEYFGISGPTNPECLKSHSGSNNLTCEPPPNRKNVTYVQKKQPKTDEKPSKNLCTLSHDTYQNELCDPAGPYNIIHDPNKDPKDRHAPPPVVHNCTNFLTSDSGPPVEKYKPHKNIEVTAKEHQKLVEKHGIEIVNECYEYLSDWKQSANPKMVAKHSSDYLRLRTWVATTVLDQRQKNDRIKQQSNHKNIAPHRQGSKLVTPGDAEYDGSRIKRL